MRTRVSTLCLFLVTALPLLAAPEPIKTTGKLDAVTVYRGQAMVTRLVQVPAPAGLHEVIVTDLPDQILPGSLYAESADGVEVRSVRYRISPVIEDVREEVRALDAELKELKDQIQANDKALQVVAHRREYLDKLEQFVAPTATVEMTQGVLNAETLKSLSEYQLAQREAIAEKELAIARERAALDEQVNLLQRKRQELTNNSSKSVREAVVFINLKEGGSGQMRLRYLVGQANWAPSYNARITGDRKSVLLEYNASIQQMSGEDWADVNMTLSTATPSLLAKAPTLTPLTMSLTRPQPQQQAAQGGPSSMGEYAGRKKDVAARQVEVWSSANSAGISNGAAGNLVFDLDLSNTAQPQGGQGVGGSGLGMGAGYSNFFQQQRLEEGLNTLAGELQNFELTARGNINNRGKVITAGGDEGISVTYAIASRTSLPSRADQQLIQIDGLRMGAEFYRVAMPVLTRYVYEEAALANSSDRVLLSGPVMTFMDGEFVGHGQIPTVAAGERFTLGLGIDSSLKAVRELVTKTEDIQGGNRVVNLTYKLSVENFGDKPVAVRLLDRLPNTQESEIKLTLVSSGPSLADDEVYLATDRKKGILRWEVEVPANATVNNAFGLEYQVKLEYDKQMTLSGMGVAAANPLQPAAPQ